MSGERIPPPADPAERERWERDLAALEADPRTAGTAPRPPWLVERVLRDRRG